MVQFFRRHRRRTLLGVLRLICAVTCLLGGGASLATAEGLARHHHNWGRFQPGAWNLVQVVTETFEDTGVTTSTTETRTSLEEVHEDGVTLSVTVSVGPIGRRFATEPQSVKQAFYGGLASEEATVTSLGAAVVTIQGCRIPCKIEQVEVSSQSGKTTTKIYYSDSVEPYVLRRESVKMDPDGKTVLSETTVEIVEFGVPCRRVHGPSRTTHVKAVHKHAGGTTERFSWVSTAVPGGIVWQYSKELDKNDHLVRRVTLTLDDWGLQPETERTGIFARRRANRDRKARRRTPYRFPSSETD
jgi:hypothetical protein